MRMLLACALVALPMVADTTATGTAKATVQPAPATVTHDANGSLNFGLITSGPAVQNIVVTPANGDKFEVTKDPNETLVILLPSAPLPVTNTTDPTQVCTLKNLNTPGALFLSSASTSGVVMVGGTLDVPVWIKKGSYTGNYTVTVQYQ